MNIGERSIELQYAYFWLTTPDDLKPSYKILAALLSSVLLTIAWPATGSMAPLLLIALVPLFVMERKVYEAKKKGKKNHLFLYVWLMFFLFNLFTTWWVWNASPFGAVMAILLNSLFIAIVFQLIHFTRINLGNRQAAFALVFLWPAWEYLHMDWDLSWPWLTLGNGFANFPRWIQWYEYTGVLGGTFWVLVSNLMVADWIGRLKKYDLKPLSGPALVFGLPWLLWVLVPVVVSLNMFYGYEETPNPVEVVAVQPNIDPYNEKFGGLSSSEQVQRMVNLAEEKVTDNTVYVIAPETAIPMAFDERDFTKMEEYAIISSFLKAHPETEFIIGASTFSIYDNAYQKSPTARYSQRSGVWYDNHNTAIDIAPGHTPEFYHKSKLVPGVEKMPFPAFFMHFQEFAFNLGGVAGSLGGQDERTVFGHDGRPKVAPVICYESIYGEFLGEYIKNGAELIFIITNDGWWGDTPGYKQHMQYASLAAIEHRRSIARSANTGISCFVDQRGIISQKTGWWVPAAIRGTLNANDRITFYSEYGDYIGRIGFWFGMLILLYAATRFLIRKT